MGAVVFFNGLDLLVLGMAAVAVLVAIVANAIDKKANNKRRK